MAQSKPIKPKPSEPTDSKVEKPSRDAKTSVPGIGSKPMITDYASL